MAITKLNSLAIPDDTIVEADLSYPLTGFSSTGIDDNATSTAITIDASQKATFSNSIEATVAYRAYDSVAAAYRNVLRYDSGNVRLETGSAGSQAITAFTGGAERMRIDSSGNVILNQSAGAADNTILRITGGTAGFSTLHLADTADINIGYVQYDHTNNALTFASNNAERMRIDSSGNLGLGDQSPTAVTSSATTLEIKGGVTTKGGAIKLNSSDESINSFIYPDATNGLSINMLTAHPMRFLTSGTERMRILSSGGITFNGDTAQANALDDYEEGTHTCTVTMGSGSCSLYSNYDKIKYTKIGDLVTIQGQIRVESVSSPSGEMRVSMPFSINTTADEGSNISGSVVRTYLGNAPTGGLFLHGTMVFNQGNQCVVQWSKSGSATVNHVPTAGEYLVFNFSYKVA